MRGVRIDMQGDLTGVVLQNERCEYLYMNSLSISDLSGDSC